MSMQPTGSSDTLAALGARLLAWYADQRRDLPWRRSRDPYAIWVAETMLQQTQVATVIAYYERFMARFPTLQALAAASLDDVLKAWEGLGYYARARNLHRASQQLAGGESGRLPESVDALQRLPGIGRYTAAAIASIAFGHDAVALDGNLIRVLCRLFSIDEDPDRPSTRLRLERIAAGLMPPGRAGDANQALMDLGATICTPTQPRCLMCPFRGVCAAQQAGIQEALPIRAARLARPHRDVTAAIIWAAAERFLITRRPLDSMLGGLWEFPGGKCLPEESLEACLRREIEEELGVHIDVGELVCAVDHTFTHWHMTLYAYDCHIVTGTPHCLACLDLRWVTLDDLDAFAFPAADQKIIAVLRERRTGRV